MAVTGDVPHIFLIGPVPRFLSDWPAEGAKAFVLLYTAVGRYHDKKKKKEEEPCRTSSEK
jgi:hypothetical protein